MLNTSYKQFWKKDTIFFNLYLHSLLFLIQLQPTSSPTRSPSYSPTGSPSKSPSVSPTSSPTKEVSCHTTNFLILFYLNSSHFFHSSPLNYSPPQALPILLRIALLDRRQRVLLRRPRPVQQRLHVRTI